MSTYHLPEEVQRHRMTRTGHTGYLPAAPTGHTGYLPPAPRGHGVPPSGAHILALIPRRIQHSKWCFAGGTSAATRSEVHQANPKRKVSSEVPKPKIPRNKKLQVPIEGHQRRAYKRTFQSEGSQTKSPKRRIPHANSPTKYFEWKFPCKRSQVKRSSARALWNHAQKPKNLVVCRTCLAHREICFWIYIIKIVLRRWGIENYTFFITKQHPNLNLNFICVKKTWNGFYPKLSIFQECTLNFFQGRYPIFFKEGTLNFFIFKRGNHKTLISR